MVKLRETSRLRFAKLFSTGGVEHWDLPEYPIIENAPDDILYTVSRTDRIDLLAFRFYGSAELWWIIALANGYELLPTDLRENTTLRIPSGQRVFTQILRSANRGEEGR